MIEALPMLRISFLLLFILCAGGSAFAQNTAQPAVDPVAQAEQLTQQIRAEERKIDLQNNNIKWLPWDQSGQSVQDFVMKRDKFYRSLIGTGRHIDIAINDMDGNGQPDIVLFFWDHCGNQGCLYKIYYDQEKKKTDNFFGWEFIPYKNGVMLDHAYFAL
jgi:hypothetical protein